MINFTANDKTEQKIHSGRAIIHSSRYGIKGVNIRNDNGSQFIANDVRQFLPAAEANQEFTHIATPEENAYLVQSNFKRTRLIILHLYS